MTASVEQVGKNSPLAPQTSCAPTLAVTAGDLFTVLRAAAAAVGDRKDPQRSDLGLIRLDLTAGNVVAWATNRMIVAKVVLDCSGAGLPGLTGADMSWAGYVDPADVAAAAKSLFFGRSKPSRTEDQDVVFVRFDVNEVSFPGRVETVTVPRRWPIGHFPDLAKLVDGSTGEGAGREELSIRSDVIAAVLDIARAAGDKLNPIHFTSTGTAPAAPVGFRIDLRHRVSAEGIFMPARHTSMGGNQR